ncbi:MAG: helix-turn-helix domain-containing protein [Anaerolineae bacterium]|nr:helix-turn-helix domain-containing protein [Anaerolineae bacterium]
MPKKIYVVKLTDEERAEFEALVTKGKAAAWKRQRAQALLLCDESEGAPGWIDQRIAEGVRCTRQSVENWRKQAVEQGPASLLERKERPPPVTPKLDGEKQAVLVKLACSQAPEGRAKWTMQLLANKLVELEVVDTISHETVRRGLKKIASSPGAK